MKKASKIQIAQSYATALFDAASEAGQVERVWDECVQIREAVAQVDEFAVLQNPVWSMTQKKAVMTQICDSLGLSDTTKGFLLLMTQKGQIGQLSAVLDAFGHIFYARNHIKEVTVETVLPLSDEQHQKLGLGLAQAFGQKVVLSYVINPELLGGLVVRTGSQQIDDSIAGKLHRLEQVMKGKK
jgi:F-type H+-transporting ATPase subunit delta